VHGICAKSVRAGRSDGENRCPDTHDESATENAKPAAEARSAEFVEKKKAPENAKKRIRIPKGKRDAEADVANGVDGERVGDGPKAACENRPKDKMGRATGVGADGTGTEDERRDAPAREEYSNNHDQRNDHWRQTERDELCGSFGGAEPCSGGEPGENAEELESSGAGRKICFGGGRRSGHCQRIHSKRRRPTRRTVTGTQN